MREQQFIKELEGSIEQLLPVPGLEVEIERGRPAPWNLRVKANYQGLRFDLLIELVPANKVISDLGTLSEKHPAWFKKFLSNRSAQFKSPDAEGPIRIVEQRPPDAFPNLDIDQLRHYSHGIMEQFIQKIGSFR